MAAQSLGKSFLNPNDEAAVARERCRQLRSHESNWKCVEYGADDEAEHDVHEGVLAAAVDGKARAGAHMLGAV
jgi:hypothetical protein